MATYETRPANQSHFNAAETSPINNGESKFSNTSTRQGLEAHTYHDHASHASPASPASPASQHPHEERGIPPTGEHGTSPISGGPESQPGEFDVKGGRHYDPVGDSVGMTSKGAKPMNFSSSGKKHEGYEDHDNVEKKATLGDKVAGTVEQFVGKVTKNPTKIEEGELRKTEGKSAVQEMFTTQS